MLIDENGRFYTQREEPRLALVKCTLESESLVLEIDSHGSIRVPFQSEEQILRVNVWQDSVEAKLEKTDFFSSFFQKPLRLVRITKAGRYTGEDKRPIRFADSSAVNLANTASLADLNSKLHEPVDMLRFRPNLVVQGDQAWQEDHWNFIRIGGFEFRRRKATTRCSITSVDQKTGLRKGPEPLKTLASFRRNADGQIEFAQHFYSCENALIHVGMEVEFG